MLLSILLEKQVKLPLVSTVGTSCLLSDPEPEIDMYVVCCYCSMHCRVDCYRLTAHQSVSQIAETLLCSKKCVNTTLLITVCAIATTDCSVETPFEPGFMRPTPPLHRVDDEVGVVMTIYL